MKFVYNGDTYIIEFERSYKERMHGGKTKYPQTTVRLVRNKVGTLPGEIFRTATSGCYQLDKFTLEKGRIVALRKITPTLDKALRHLVWTTYTNRFPVVEKK